MEQKAPYKLHAIQLMELRVSELSIKADLSVPRGTEVGSFGMETGHSDYDSEEKQIQVKMAVSMGKDDSEKPPFRLLAEVHAIFKIDESQFEIKFIEDWAAKNAPLVLYPYVRELVYSLTSRAGFLEVQLPLLEVPTFKLGPPVKVGDSTVAPKAQ